MRFPFDQYKLGTRYGTKGRLWQCGYHSGLDLLSANYGGDGLVYPLYAGRVQRVSSGGSYGNCVYILHPDGYITLYAHLRRVYVKAGQNVTEKTVLGIEGQTGNVTGRHLHLEVHKGAYHYPAVIDPLAFIQAGIKAQAENNKTEIEEAEEMQKVLTMSLNGRIKEVTAIEKDGYNYVRLQDLRDAKISIGYDEDARMPVVRVI